MWSAQHGECAAAEGDASLLKFPFMSHNTFRVSMGDHQWPENRRIAMRVTADSDISVLRPGGSDDTVCKGTHRNSGGSPQRWEMAVAEGFEPPDGVSRLSLSRRVH